MGVNYGNSAVVTGKSEVFQSRNSVYPTTHPLATSWRGGIGDPRPWWPRRAFGGGCGRSADRQNHFHFFTGVGWPEEAAKAAATGRSEPKAIGWKPPAAGEVTVSW